MKYRLGEPVFDERECHLRGATFAAPLRVLLRLVIYDKEAPAGSKVVKDIREQEVYMGELPLMTGHRHLHHQRDRARHRLAVAPFARCLLRSRQGQDPLLGQAAVLGARHSLSRILARFRVRSQGQRLRAHRPSPQAAGDRPAARAGLWRRGHPVAFLRDRHLPYPRPATSPWIWCPSACAARPSVSTSRSATRCWSNPGAGSPRAISASCRRPVSSVWRCRPNS